MQRVPRYVPAAVVRRKPRALGSTHLERALEYVWELTWRGAGGIGGFLYSRKKRSAATASAQWYRGRALKRFLLVADIADAGESQTVGPQIAVVDMPIQPMAPCASTFS
jgi:hypothetical protein